jgi:hypothetical protein
MQLPGDLVTGMATIRFDRQDELDELIARIYLDTSKKFTKKELLELLFEIGREDYDHVLEHVKKPHVTSDHDLRVNFIKKFKGVLSIPDQDVDDVQPKLIWEKKVD